MSDSAHRIPPLVTAAREAAEAAGFTRSCKDEFGRLLRVFAAASPGPVAELGTGCAVGTAWLAGGLRPGTRLVTVESDPVLAGRAADFFRQRDDVEVVAGGWRAVRSRGPFTLLFADCPGTKVLTPELADYVAVGGVVLIDDLTPEWLPRPPELQGLARDEVRESWLSHPGFTGVEIYPSRDTAALVVTRMS
jgi:predicted O-methyltransferase YrrM